jgi:hypothetical protein
VIQGSLVPAPLSRLVYSASKQWKVDAFFGLFL